MSQFVRRWLPLLLILTLYGCSVRQLEVLPFEFTILQINDVYEIAPLEGGEVGGIARVASLLRELEAENPNTIAVLAGDFLSPSFMGTLRMDDGEKIAGLQMIESLNAMGLDYATFGNHEFDLGSAELLQKRLEESAFRYMSCNARRRSNGELAPFTQHGVLVPDYAVHTFTNIDGRSIRLALVGVVLPFNQADYVGYLDVEDSFGNAVKSARQEAEVVMGLTHLSIDGDMALAEAVPGLPLIMGGHEHENLSRYVGQTPITKADANAKTAYVHRVTYFPSSRICRVNSSLVPITKDLGDEETTQVVVDKWQGQIAELVGGMGYNGERALMTANTPLNGTEAAIRTRQTNYGQLTNKAFEAAWPGGDVYLFNGGSLRLDDNMVGTITEYDVLRSFPYGGPIVRMPMSGTTLRQLLEVGASNRGEGGYLQRWHAEKQGNTWHIQGSPINTERTYQVILPEFVAKGLEANLGFLGELTYEKLDHFPAEGSPLRNDIRDLVIAYMERIRVWE